MALAKFQENRFRIDGVIADNQAILVNLTASIRWTWSWTRPIVKVTLNLSLSRCMFFAHCSSNFHPILMKFDKR